MAALPVHNFMALLPAEMVDKIIDELRGDVPSLHACALTCRAWRPRSRYNLFYIINVTRRTNPRMLAYILYGVTYSPFHFSHEVHIRDCAIGPRRLVDVVNDFLGPTMPNVKVLKVEGADWFPTLYHDMSPLSNFSAISTLSLQACIFHTVLQFERMICGLLNLSDLTLLQFTLWPAAADGNTQRKLILASHASEGPRLSRLKIIDCIKSATQYVLRWLLDTSTQTSLLSLVLCTEVEARFVCDTLGSYTFLQSLDLRLSSNPAFSDTPVFIHLPQLHTLHLRYPVTGYPMIATFLSRVASPSLRKFEWTISVKSPDEIFTAWQYLYIGLMEDACPRLELCVLYVPGVPHHAMYGFMRDLSSEARGWPTVYRSKGAVYFEDPASRKVQIVGERGGGTV